MNYLFHYPEFFNTGSILVLLLSVALSVSCIFFYKKNEPVLRFVLFVLGATVAYFACSLDLFIHDWDEEFHALVAKNMISNPFKPVLYKNLLFTSNSAWNVTHIWLHKQPLFLWQMALSMKFFGINEISLRLPNILAHGIMAIMIYDIGKLMSNNFIGLLSSLSFCYLKFPLCYAAGMLATDHNDYMFLFYVTASFWSLFKYRNGHAIKFLLLTGVFCGCAILVKWLPGLLAIGIWISHSIFYERKQLLNSALAFIVALLISIPWQIYAYIKYRSIFLTEFDFNLKHFWQPLEGHNGPWYFHFESIRELYGNNDLIFFAIGISLVYFGFSKKIDTFFKFCVLMSIFSVYLFFSLAQTKMPAFCIIVIPHVILTLVFLICDLMEKIKIEKLRRGIFCLLIPTMMIFFFSPGFFIKQHTLGYKPQEERISHGLNQKAFIFHLDKTYDKRTIFLNARSMALKIMFYTNHEACNYIPAKETIELLKSQNCKLAAFDVELPDYALNDSSITKIPINKKLSF